jgi:hypothetical protein
LDFFVDEIEVDVLRNLPQNMIAADALIQIDMVVKQLRLWIWLATHHGGSTPLNLLCYF